MSWRTDVYHLVMKNVVKKNCWRSRAVHLWNRLMVSVHRNIEAIAACKFIQFQGRAFFKRMGPFTIVHAGCRAGNRKPISKAMITTNMHRQFKWCDRLSDACEAHIADNWLVIRNSNGAKPIVHDCKYRTQKPIVDSALSLCVSTYSLILTPHLV